MTAIKVVTYETPGGGVRAAVSVAQERRLKEANVWLKSTGRELCQVLFGAHLGYPTFSDAEINEIIERGGVI